MKQRKERVRIPNRNRDQQDHQALVGKFEHLAGSLSAVLGDERCPSVLYNALSEMVDNVSNASPGETRATEVYHCFAEWCERITKEEQKAR